MKQATYLLLILISWSALQSGCKKDYRNIAPMVVPKAQVITDGVPLCGSLKGYMVSGKTYIIDSCGIVVNQGDTLFIQNNVHINMNHGACITVRGVLVSNGTKDNPNWITVPGVTKTDDPSALVATDPAYQGKWLGILCDTSCPLLVMKWTHLEYSGGTIVTPTTAALGAGKAAYTILFENSAGKLIVEDNWFYGSTNDAIRIQGGYFSVMRNTFEKNGIAGADIINVKHASVGIAAYNLFIGTGTNGSKASDKGATIGPTTDFDMYNNTYVNGGWREASAATGKGACINYEQNSYGNYYNNLVVNCIYGPRVVLNPVADTSRMKYGYTYFYGDSVKIVNQFYPSGYITLPQASDYPAPASYLPSTYFGHLPDTVYNAPQLATQNDPQFVNYPLPCPTGTVIAYVGTYDFHLKSTSPCIGKGSKTVTVMAPPVPVDPIYGATELTPPGADAGCYQSDGTGNQH